MEQKKQHEAAAESRRADCPAFLLLNSDKHFEYVDYTINDRRHKDIRKQRVGEEEKNYRCISEDVIHVSTSSTFGENESDGALPPISASKCID